MDRVTAEGLARRQEDKATFRLPGSLEKVFAGLYALPSIG